MNNDDFQALRKALTEAGITVEQLRESFERLLRIQDEGGFGVVSWVVKRGRIYKIDHTVHGKPVVFKDGEEDI